MGTLIGIAMLLGVCQALVFNPSTETAVDKLIEDVMACHHIPGLTISVVKGGDTWTKGYGFADMTTNSSVDNTTLFSIGSITKGFTMALLARILNDTSQHYNWESKVSDILGHGFKFVDDERTKGIMLRDLLAHRTGLSTLDASLLGGYPTGISRAKLSQRLHLLKAVRPFRDTFIYNNAMYMLAGHVAEVLTNDTWENLIRKAIFDPVGMNDTRILTKPADVLAQSVAKPYVYENGKFVRSTKELYRLHPMEPAGSILSSANDMAKWIHFLLRGAKTENGTPVIDLRLLSEGFYTQMHPTISDSRRLSLTKPIFPVDDINTGYGYGWYKAYYKGYRRFWHNGILVSYYSMVWLFPDLQFGMFASVNGPGVGAHPGVAVQSILYYVSDILLGDKLWLNSSTSCTFPAPWVKIPNHNHTHISNVTNDTTVANADEYVGIYGNYLYPDIHIVRRGAGLDFSLGVLKGEFHTTSQKDHFKVTTTYPWELSDAGVHANETQKLDVMFAREAGIITSFEITFMVKEVFRKGVSITNEIPSNGGKGPNLVG